MVKVNLNNLGDFQRTTKAEQIKYCCPFCQEEKFRFSVNLKKGIYHCFRCNVSGRINKLEIPLDNFRERVSDFINTLKHREKVVNPKISLPPEVKEITKESGLPYRYLRRRRITEAEIKRFNMKYCDDGIFEGRIIVPIYQDDVIKYYVGRAYYNKEPKYLNSPVSKANIIFKTFKKAKHAVIVEGIFDALSVGKVYPSIALLGKTISKGQIEQIYNSAKRVTILLDPDAKEWAFKLANILSYGVKTNIILIEGEKDPGDLFPGAIVKLVGGKSHAYFRQLT